MTERRWDADTATHNILRCSPAIQYVKLVVLLLDQLHSWLEKLDQTSSMVTVSQIVDRDRSSFTTFSIVRSTLCLRNRYMASATLSQPSYISAVNAADVLGSFQLSRDSDMRLPYQLSPHHTSMPRGPAVSPSTSNRAFLTALLGLLSGELCFTSPRLAEVMISHTSLQRT